MERRKKLYHLGEKTDCVGVKAVYENLFIPGLRIAQACDGLTSAQVRGFVKG